MTVLFSKKTKLIWICVCMAILMTLRCFSNIFIYPAIALGVASILLLQSSQGFLLLLFLLPFSAIYKISPEQVSIFTVVFALYVFKSVFVRGKLKRSFLVAILCLTTFMIAFSGLSKLISIVTVILGMLLLHEMSYLDVKNYPVAIKMLAISYIVASLISYFFSDAPLLASFIRQRDGIYSGGEWLDGTRFAGLSHNSNYYALDVIVVLSCQAVMLLKKKSWETAALFIILSVFGFLSISKTFLVVWSFLMLLFLIAALRTNPKIFLWILAVVLVGAFVLYYAAGDVLSLYLARMTLDTTKSLAEFTTSRSTIWSMYLGEILTTPKTFLVGEGLQEILIVGTHARSSHNAYLELFFNLGIIGSVLYLFSIFSAISLPKATRKDPMLYMPFWVLAVNLMSIDFLTYDNSLFYIALLCFMMTYYRRVGQIMPNAGDNELLSSSQREIPAHPEPECDA